ncbi:hypothetical protein CFP56_001286 [Quercus suber]|uniref:DUF4283 domain-containing protein n=1 Tax=Quercus suber TaxID=58331 RepID=A0AAW0IN97_QUESU
MRCSRNITLRAEEIAGLLYSLLKKLLRLCNGLRLVCQFLDKQLSFFLVKRSVQTLWKPFGGVEVLTFENDLFLFKFVLVQDRDAVLNARLWYPGLQLSNLKLGKIPFCVKFLQLPIELWTPKCLSWEGHYMLMQSLNYTRGLDMLEFVWKLDLMMNFLIPWLLFFFGPLVVELPDGKTLEVGIEYPWKPENVCIAKCLITYPNSIRLIRPSLGFPRIRVGNGNDEEGLQEQISVLREDELCEFQDKAKISESADTGIKDPTVAFVVSPNARQGNRSVTRAQVAAGKKAEGCEEGALGQFTLLEFMDAAIEKGAKLKQIKTVKAKETKANKNCESQGKGGLSDPSKQREVKKLIRDRRVNFVYLVVTKVKDWNALQKKEPLFPNWGFLNNYDSHELGRVWVC